MGAIYIFGGIHWGMNALRF